MIAPRQDYSTASAVASLDYLRFRSYVRQNEKGRLIGTIQTRSGILGESVDEATLGNRALEELRRLADELQGRVRDKLAGQ